MIFYIDYGNEKECGEGVARAIKDGLVKREDLFLVSKLWNSFHEKERVEPICKKQLADWVSIIFLGTSRQTECLTLS